MYVEKREPSQTRVGHGRSEGSLNSLQPTEGSFRRATCDWKSAEDFDKGCNVRKHGANMS